MKIFTITLLGFIVLHLNAHEEPAKTILEKQEKERIRQEIKKKKIKAVSIWKVLINKGIEGKHKYKYLESKYDKQGLLISLEMYKKNGKKALQVLYTYDKNHNLLSDTDFNNKNEILERIEYKYDLKGRVKSALCYKGKKYIAKFIYKRHSHKSTIEFQKYTKNNVLEYTITYKYLSKSYKHLISAKKWSPKKKLLLFVTYSYFPSGERKEKAIYGGKNTLLYKFLYKWYKKKYKEIAKITPKGEAEYIQKFLCDINANYKEISVYNGKNTLKNKLIYKYKYFK